MDRKIVRNKHFDKPVEHDLGAKALMLLIALFASVKGYYLIGCVCSVFLVVSSLKNFRKGDKAFSLLSVLLLILNAFFLIAL